MPEKCFECSLTDIRNWKYASFGNKANLKRNLLKTDSGPIGSIAKDLGIASSGLTYLRRRTTCMRTLKLEY